jgi:hypothetical protein
MQSKPRNPVLEAAGADLVRKLPDAGRAIEAYACVQPMPTRHQVSRCGALAIERQHGDHAPVYIAERIGALALAGDQAGIERFRQIAARLDQLRNPQQFLPG